jgi:hypothetical protein
VAHTGRGVLIWGLPELIGYRKKMETAEKMAVKMKLVCTV